MRSLTAFLAALVVAVLGTASVAAAAVDPYEEMAYCSGLGPKPPGSGAGRAQADRIADRFRSAGLKTSFEDFYIPVYVARRTSLRTLGPDGGEVRGGTFAYGGTGRVEAEVVDVGTGRASDYLGKDVEGKIVMVRRDTAFHRSSQLVEVVRHGGAAMLYVSGSPDNLIQTGTVRFAQHPPATIPAVTVGADDGAALREQIDNGALTMAIEVDAERQNARARNVIGVRQGTTHPDKVMVVGGHYDNWHKGAVDNCTAVGSLLGVADAVEDVPLAYTVVFAAWDAEEVGLTGSYDYVARHPSVIGRTVFTENLEMTAGAANDLAVRFGTTAPAMLAAANAAGLANGYGPVDVPALAIRQISGGIIPTDLQPFYSAGVQGLSTFTNTPYYHTAEDTPEKVDPASLERVTAYLADLLVNVQSIPPEAFAIREVPKVSVAAPASAVPGTPVTVRVKATDGYGNPLAGEDVSILVNQLDHWAVAQGTASELGAGEYEYTIPAGATEADVTRVTATISRTSDVAEGYARIDQRAGGILPPTKRVCFSSRVIRIAINAPRGAGKVVRLRAATTAGRVRVVGRRAVRLDLRSVRPRTVTVTATVKTSEGRALRQARTYRKCVTSRSLQAAVGVIEDARHSSAPTLAGDVPSVPVQRSGAGARAFPLSIAVQAGTGVALAVSVAAH